MNFQTMNKQRKLILIAAVVGIISIFLPWFSAGAFGFSVSTNGFHGWGVLAFFAFVIGGIVSLIGEQTQSLEKNLWFVAMICGALALLSVIISIISSRTGDYAFVSADLGVGIWLALIAAAAVVAFAWLFKNPEHNLKGGFENLKQAVASSSVNTNKNVPAESNIIAELERLNKLKESGSITEEEFRQLKSKLI